MRKTPRPSNLSFIAADFERRRPRQQRPAAVADEIRVKVVDQHTATARIRSNRPGEVGIGVDRPEEAIDEARRLRRGQRGVDLLFQLGRMPQIVGIDRRDERSAPPRDAQVSRRRAATILLANQRHARVVAYKAPGNVGGAVGRPVVDDEHLDVAVGLGQHRAERLSQRPLGIEGRDDDGDQRICRRHGAATAAAYLPRILRWLSRSRTMFASPSWQQAEAAGDFLIGFVLAAEVAAEAVLVELLAGGHVPQPAAVGADLVGEDDAAIVIVPDPAELELEVDQADVDRRRTCRT